MKLHEVFHISNSFRSFCPRCSFPSSQHQYIAPSTLPTQCSWDSILKCISYHLRIIYFCRAWSDHFLILLQSTAPQIAVWLQGRGREGEQQPHTQVALAGCPLSTLLSLSHSPDAAKQRGLSNRVRATTPSHSHSWGKIPSTPPLHSLRKLKEEGDSTSPPPGNNAAPEHKHQPSPTSPLLGTACPTPPHRSGFPRRQPSTWEPSPATQTRDISFPKESLEAGKPSGFQQLFAPTGPETCSALRVTIWHDPASGDRIDFCWRRSLPLPVTGAEWQGHHGHHSPLHRCTHSSSAALTVPVLLPPHHSTKIKAT